MVTQCPLDFGNLQTVSRLVLMIANAESVS
jgi:hypothetical protein